MKKIVLFSTAIAAFLIASAQIPQNGLIAHFNLNGTQGFNSNVNGNPIIPDVYTSDSRSGGLTKPIPAPNRYNETDSAGSFLYTSYQYELADVNSTKNSKLKVKKQISFGGWMMFNGYDNFNLSPIFFGVWGPSYGSYGFQGNLNNGNIYMMMSSNTSNNQNLSVNITSDGSGGVAYFRHLMGTLGADDTMRFYFQGRLIGKKKFVGDSIQYFDYSNSKKYFSMGAQYTSNGWNGTGFNGSGDDIVIYDRELTASEIWTMFNNSSKCTNSNAIKPGHLLRKITGQLTVADTTTWHPDNCEFEWYANNNLGITTSKASGKTIAITQNATYKVKVVHRATRCWYWTNDIVVADLAGGTNGVENSQLDNIMVYPNPVEDKLFISNNDQIMNVKIYSTNGQIMKTINAENTKEIDTKSFPVGLYIVQIETTKGITTHKIIKN